MLNEIIRSTIPIGEVNETLGKMLINRAGLWPRLPVYAYRHNQEYRTISWQEFIQDLMNLVAFFDSRGIGKGERIAVFSPNSYAMLVWEMAALSLGAVSVPIFAGYDSSDVDYILSHAEPSALLVEGTDRLEQVKACGNSTHIGTLVTSSVKDSPGIDFDHCIANRDINRVSQIIDAVEPGDVCFIQYTSGTTGAPKGVMLTHRNILSQRLSQEKIWNIPNGSRFLSYLPWHHSYGGLFERFTALYHGATLYAEDSLGKDLNRLMENWQLVKPSHFFSVPKIYRSLVTEARLKPGLGDALFHPGFKFLFTAAAPLPSECRDFFKEYNIPIYEGWGLTETSPTVTFVQPGCQKDPRYVGEPIPGCEIKIAQDGEILVKGPNVMKGYYKAPQKTAAALDQEGWLHTGDLGEISGEGLRLKCRKDGIFKLSNGEKVSAGQIEEILTDDSSLISHAVVAGSGENFVCALLFPNFRYLEAWAHEKNRELPRGNDLAIDKEIGDCFIAEVAKKMKDLKPSFLRVKAFVIIPEELTIKNGGLTPSLKVIRHQVRKRNRNWLDAIYSPAEHREQQKYIIEMTTVYNNIKINNNYQEEDYHARI